MFNIKSNYRYELADNKLLTMKIYCYWHDEEGETGKLRRFKSGEKNSMMLQIMRAIHWNFYWKVSNLKSNWFYIFIVQKSFYRLFNFCAFFRYATIFNNKLHSFISMHKLTRCLYGIKNWSSIVSMNFEKQM